MPNTREKLIELLNKYFTIGDSYAYNLTRVKEAFAVGTMSLDDFVEFNEEVTADIADHLIANGVTVQEWISVKDRLPEEDVRVLVHVDPNSKWNTEVELDTDRRHKNRWVRWGEAITHWMPLPEPPKKGADNGSL